MYSESNVSDATVEAQPMTLSVGAGAHRACWVERGDGEEW